MLQELQQGQFHRAVRGHQVTINAEAQADGLNPGNVVPQLALIRFLRVFLEG